MSGPIPSFRPRVTAILLLAALHLSAHAAQDVLLEAELSQPEVRVNEQAVYRLRALHPIHTAEVTLGAPSARLADLREIGTERTYEAARGNRRYHVHERSYAVFPIAGGTLVLSGAHATVPAAASSGPAIRLVAPARRLTVLPIPAQADGVPWLPASTLTLSETWSPAEHGAHRRTIRIEATGIDAALLPELHIAAEGLAVRSEAPRLENRFDGEWNIGVREQAFIITPTRNGLAVAPELLLQWWNVRADLPSFALLPARTLHTAPPEPIEAGSAPGAATVLGHVTLILCALLLIVYRQRSRLRDTAMKFLKRAGTTDTAVL